MTKNPAYRPRILLAMPCFNEAKFLKVTLQELKRSLHVHAELLDIVVFDDGSSDNSVNIALKEKVRVHAVPFNRGLGENFKAIVDHAISGQYDFLLTCDADGQFPSSEVKKLLDFAIESEADFILASRFLNSEYATNVPTIRTKGNYLVQFITSLITGKKVSDATCGLRVYKRSAFSQLRPSEKFSYTIESLVQLLLAKLKVDEVPIQVIYFNHRKSAISGSLFKYGVKTVAISLRLLLSVALSRLLRISSLLFFPGILLLVLFFLRSYETGKFIGNLYLGFSGLTLTGFGFVSFFFYLMSAKIDELQKGQLLTYNLVKPIQNTCVFCKSTKKGL